MKDEIAVLAAILFPFVAGVLLAVLKCIKTRKGVHIYAGISLVLSGLLTLVLLLGTGTGFEAFELMEGFEVVFGPDNLGKLFVAVVSIVWILAGFFSFTYMRHEKNERRYFAFYLMALAALTGLGCAGNLITMYAFFEFLTVTSFPLVLHNQSREAIMAALKYLLYSLFGAYMALFGLFFLWKYAASYQFVPGGALNMELAASHSTLLLLAAFFMIIGFGVKAGMFPMHAWLPTAHPVAPAPASAVLSAVVVKAGVLAIVRTVFYVFGADFIRGTWVQYAFLALALLTVFMGSMLAFKENILKKRLAYSTVSQLAYILAGIAFLEPTALTGAFLHILAHAFIKGTLFLAAGAIIFRTGITSVDDLTGIGRRMPITLWCYTIVSLGLIGIPPTSGFISKWYLATGALSSQTGLFCYLGPVILLVSALLTAGYLLPVTIKGFLPGNDFMMKKEDKCEANLFMLIPMLVLTALSVLAGMFPNMLLGYIGEIVNALL